MAKTRKTTGTHYPRKTSMPEGVVATVIKTIQRPAGATANELLAVLVKHFPDRTPKGMMTTARIQANKHATRRAKDEDGATRYFGQRQ